MAILDVNDQSEAERIIAGDPVLKANVGFSHACHPMLHAKVRT